MSEKDIVALLQAELEALLAAVHADDPKREILVRVGDAMRHAKEAADTIERLRVELYTARNEVSSYHGFWIAERDRLTAALTRAAEMREACARLAENGEWTPDGDDPYCGKQIASAIRNLKVGGG